MPVKFDRIHAPRIVRAARLDRGMSQAELSRAAGMSQPNVAAIETGTRTPSAEALTRLLQAADYRPSLAVEEHSEAIVETGARHGLRDIRVFGSIATGTDHFASDIDLLARVDSGRGYFDIAAFVNAVEELTGFAVDVIVDDERRPAFLASVLMVPAVTGPESRPARFTRVPRSSKSGADVARDNLLQSLDAIDAFVVHATSGGRNELVRDSSAYASGCMAVIRAAALFEVDDFAEFLRATPDEVVNALRAMRNMASHSGYRAMNDEFLWVSLTVELPPYLALWRRAAQEAGTG